MLNAFNYLQALKAEEIKEAVPGLIAALKDPNWRGRAVQELGRIGPAAKDAVPALNELLRSDNPQLRENVITPLKAISPSDKH